MVSSDAESEVQRAVAQVTEAIDAYPAMYAAKLLQGQRAKLGLYDAAPADDGADGALAEDWLGLLHTQAVDFTLGWRRLADAAEGRDGPLRALFAAPEALDPWLTRWRERCARDDAAAGPGPRGERALRMRRVNPWLIARNHRVEEALAAASDDGNLTPFDQLLAALQRPYDETPEHAAYAEPAPAAVTAGYRTLRRADGLHLSASSAGATGAAFSAIAVREHAEAGVP